MHISKDRKKLLAGDMDGTFVSPFNDDSADSSETISEESNTGELFHIPESVKFKLNIHRKLA